MAAWVVPLLVIKWQNSADENGQTPVSQEAHVLQIIYALTYQQSVLLKLNSLQTPLAILS